MRRTVPFGTDASWETCGDPKDGFRNARQRAYGVFRLMRDHSAGWLFLVSLVAFLSVQHADCEEKHRVSIQELEKAQLPLQQRLGQLKEQMVELQKRTRAILDEVKSPDRKRSLDDLRKEHQAVVKESARLRPLYRETQEAINQLGMDALRSRAVVITGTGMVRGVSQVLYSAFVGSLDAQESFDLRTTTRL